MQLISVRVFWRKSYRVWCYVSQLSHYFEDYSVALLGGWKDDSGEPSLTGRLEAEQHFHWRMTLRCQLFTLSFRNRAVSTRLPVAGVCLRHPLQCLQPSRTRKCWAWQPDRGRPAPHSSLWTPWPEFMFQTPWAAFSSSNYWGKRVLCG